MDHSDTPSVEQLAAELEEARRRIAALESATAEHDFSLMAECMIDGLSMLDAEGVHLDVNPALCEMTGFSREELVGTGPPHPYWPPEDYATIEADLSKTLSGDAETVSLTFMRKSGERFPVLVTPSVLRDASGAMIRAYATVKDVTPQRRAEEALRSSEERFAALFQQAPLGYQSLDEDGRFLEVNSAWLEMLGHTRDEVIGTWFGDFLAPEQVDAFRERFPVFKARGQIRTEFRMLHKSGEERTIEFEGRIGRDPDGGFRQTHCILSDVTERKQAEQALLESDRIRTTAERVARVGSWRWELATERVTWSPGMFGLFDVDPEEFDGDFTPVLETRVHPDDREALRRTTATVTESGDPLPVEYRIVHRDGSIHIVHGEGAAEHDDEGRVTAVTGYYQDVTERRRAETEIRRLNSELEARVASRTEQLDAATHELEAFAYSIAHDVRAPLRAIDGFSAMLMEDEQDRLSPEGIAELGRVRSAAQHLGRLLDELMGLSSVSRRDVLRQTVDLSALAGRIGEELRAETPSRTVTLNVQPGLVTEADPALLRLVLRELLGNAWKFTAGHATALVEVGALDAEDDDRPAFFVRDDGAGFDMRYAEHLFGPFQRMHPREQFEGTGIGLATVQRLVRRHGGRVWAEAETEKGATFYFTVPPATVPARTETGDG